MITLATFSNLNDAFVLRSMLESRDISAFIPDENTVQMDWGYINALGGVRVQVAEEDVEEAKAVLKEFKENLHRIDSSEIEPQPARAKESPEASEPIKISRWGIAIPAVLALVLVAGLGSLVFRSKELKTTLSDAIDAHNNGDFDRAIAEYSRAIELGSKNQTTYFNRGLAYQARGDQSHSSTDYEKAATDFGKAIAFDRSFTEAYSARATAELQANKYDEAIGDSDQAIRLDSGSGANYLTRGYARAQKQQYADALSDYTMALEINAQDEVAYSNRGIAYDNLGKYDEALSDYNKALDLNPKDEVAIFNRGNVFYQKGNWDKAIENFNQLLALNSKDGQTFLARGDAYESRGVYEKAIADYTQAIEINPSYGDAYNNLADLLATCPQVKFRDGKRAVALATRACELSAWASAIHVATLANACAEAGDFAIAVKWLTWYLQFPNLKPDDVSDAKARLVLFQRHQAFHAK